ncbi:MBL fold metallo-hydrolase, partial [Latilactobacillus sakei subsp. carnosus]
MTNKQPHIKAFFDEVTFTVSYVVTDETTSQCAIIDSVLDYDHASGRTNTESADAIIEYIKAEKLTLTWILETHVHADHLSAAPYLKEALGGEIVIGDHITRVQTTFGKLLNAEPMFARDGS